MRRESVGVCWGDEHTEMIGFCWILFQFDSIHSDTQQICSFRTASVVFSLFLLPQFLDFRQNVSIIFSTPIPFWFFFACFLMLDVFVLVPYHEISTTSQLNENQIWIWFFFSAHFFISFHLKTNERKSENDPQ